jgi:hypothetical protein
MRSTNWLGEMVIRFVEHSLRGGLIVLCLKGGSSTWKSRTCWLRRDDNTLNLSHLSAEKSSIEWLATSNHCNQAYSCQKRENDIKVLKSESKQAMDSLHESFLCQRYIFIESSQWRKPVEVCSNYAKSIFPDLSEIFLSILTLTTHRMRVRANLFVIFKTQGHY